MPETQLMLCHACGHHPPQDSLFCNQCGTRLVHGENGSEQPHSYTPRHLIDKVLTMRSALEGERKQVTVLFVDVQGSVAMSEQVNPEVWHQLMDQFFGLLSDGIHAHEGTINQYTGDGVMALFGAPVAHEDHARRACLAALALQVRLRQWHDELMAEYGIDFQVRMGLNSGEVVVGRIGDDLRMDYTARGHTVGLAARMESMAKPGCIYLSQFTAALIKREFELKERGDVRIKGVTHRVKLYELRRAADRARARFRTAGDRISPLVGRWEEMALLDNALERALSGEGQVVCISGAPGMGKSRLCHEFSASCRARQIPVYETRGISHFKAAPLEPLVAFARSYFDLQEADDPAAIRAKIDTRLQALDKRLTDSVDLLAEMVIADQSFVTPAEHETQMLRVMEIGQRMILAGALDESAVIVIENMQWVDDEPETRLFFDQLVQVVAANHVLVILTMRPEYQPPWTEQSHVSLFGLDGLEERPALSLLDELMGKSERLEPLKRLIIQRSGGNPLFMEELLDALLEEGKLEQGRDGLRLKAEVEDLALPAEVQAVVAARLDRISDEDKRVLQIAAVIGERFPEALPRHLSGLPVEHFEASLRRLADTGWIYQSRLEGGIEYAFHQSLVRDVAYHSQLAENRSRIHRAVAEYLCEQQGVEDGTGMALVAHHYSAAGQTMLAANWEAQAASWYGERNIESAIRHWRRLLVIADEMPAGEDRCRLSLQAHSRIIHHGAFHGLDPKEADRLIESGKGLAARCQDSILHAYFLLACGASRQTRGDLKGGLAFLREAEKLARSTEDIGIQAAIRVGLVHALLNSGQLTAAEQAAEEGLGWLADDPDLGAALLGRSPLLSLQLYQALVQGYRGDFNAAIRRVEASMEQAQQREEMQNLALGYIIRSLLASEQGHPRKSLGYAREAHALCVNAGNRITQFFSMLALGRASLLAGNLSRAHKILEEGLRGLRAGTVGFHEEPRFLVLLSQVHFAAGEYDQAKPLAREALKLAHRIGCKHVEAEAHLTIAEIALAVRGAGAGNEARELLKRAENLIGETQALFLMPRWHIAQADLAEIRSDFQLMQQALESAVDWLEEAGAKLRVKKVKSRHKNGKSVKLKNSE